MLKQNKVLITGGAGFIGSNYVSYVIENTQDQVFVLDNLTYAGDLKNLESVEKNERYTFIKGDICVDQLMDRLFQEYQFDKVVHFAAESHVDNSITGPALFIQTNIVGTFNLLHSAYRTWMTGPNELKEGFKEARFLHVSPVSRCIWACRNSVLFNCQAAFDAEFHLFSSLSLNFYNNVPVCVFSISSTRIQHILHFHAI